MDRILVVDDDQNILKVIRMRLEAEGFHVVTSKNSEEALKRSISKSGMRTGLNS